MIAKDARFWTEQAKPAGDDPAKMRIILACWHAAIEKAAKAGHNSVRESELDRPRTPIPAAARKAAEQQLANDGFIVAVADETVVSW